ncbi:transposable element Tc1 transposase [Trichonephila clavipes]|nr:transposable element Tc1 transposase [Trichonephila clavipes]
MVPGLSDLDDGMVERRFSDESRFCFFNDNQRIRVWRRRGERSNPAVTVECPTARQRGIMGLPNAIFQQDTARLYTTRISQHVQRGLQMLPWPAYSSGLSPIEHVWDVIGCRLQTLPLPRTNDQLWQMVEREW